MSALSPRVEAGFFDWEKSIDKDGKILEAEMPYFVFNVKDEDEALAEALKFTKEHLKDFEIERLEIDSRINETTFKVVVSYRGVSSNGDDPEDQVSSSVSFDTGGGIMHRTQSLSTVSKSPASAPDFGGAIGVDNEGNINGIDITMPVLNFTETHTFESSVVTNAYRKKVANLTGTVNKSAFRGFNAGEVLFLGASGSYSGKLSNNRWEITYKFAVSPNESNISLGKEISVSNKRGWDYLWVRYVDKVTDDKKNVVKTPIAAYVERVYNEGDFSDLGLGS